MNAFQTYLLRVCIAVDGCLQAFTHFGTIGITISSRIGTAAAHGHRYGLIGWWLLDHVWPFSRTLAMTGESHCAAAIRNDIARARAAIIELHDPVVIAYLRQKGKTL